MLGRRRLGGRFWLICGCGDLIFRGFYLVMVTVGGSYTRLVTNRDGVSQTAHTHGSNVVDSHGLFYDKGLTVLDPDEVAVETCNAR